MGENFRINFEEEFFNGEVVEVSVAPYAKINRSSEKTISGSGGIFTQPSSWAYLGPAFSYDGENYDKRSFSEIEEVEFRTSTSWRLDFNDSTLFLNLPATQLVVQQPASR